MKVFRCALTEEVETAIMMLKEDEAYACMH